MKLLGGRVTVETLAQGTLPSVCTVKGLFAEWQGQA